MEKLPKINIIYEDNHLLVVEKPVNIPVQEDSSKDLDMITILKNYRKIKENKPNEAYIGLVHRLDRPVGGIMVFAKTSKAASRLSNQIRENTFHKTYIAVITGTLPNQGKLEDYLIKNNKTNISNVTTPDNTNTPFIIFWEVLGEQKLFIQSPPHQYHIYFEHNLLLIIKLRL